MIPLVMALASGSHSADFLDYSNSEALPSSTNGRMTTVRLRDPFSLFAPGGRLAVSFYHQGLARDAAQWVQTNESGEDGNPNPLDIQTSYATKDGHLSFSKRRLLIPNSPVALTTFTQGAGNSADAVLAVALAGNQSPISGTTCRIGDHDYLVVVLDGRFLAVEAAAVKGRHRGADFELVFSGQRPADPATWSSDADGGAALFLGFDAQRQLKLYTGLADDVAQVEGYLAAAARQYDAFMTAAAQFERHDINATIVDYFSRYVFPSFWDAQEGAFLEFPFANKKGAWNSWTGDASELEMYFWLYYQVFGNQDLGEHDVHYYLQKNAERLRRMQTPTGAFYLRTSHSMNSFATARGAYAYNTSHMVENGLTALLLGNPNGIGVAQGYERTLSLFTAGGLRVGLAQPAPPLDLATADFRESIPDLSPTQSALTIVRSFQPPQYPWLTADETATLRRDLRGFEYQILVRNTSSEPQWLDYVEGGLVNLAVDEDRYSSYSSEKDTLPGIPRPNRMYVPGYAHPLIAEDLLARARNGGLSGQEAVDAVNREVNDIVRATHAKYCVVYGWDRLVVIYFGRLGEDQRLHLDVGESPLRRTDRPTAEWLSVRVRSDLKRMLQPGEVYSPRPLQFSHHFVVLPLADADDLPVERYVVDEWVRRLETVLDDHADSAARRQALDGVALDTNYAFVAGGAALAAASDYYEGLYQSATGADDKDTYRRLSQDYGDRALLTSMYMTKVFDSTFYDRGVFPVYSVMRFFGYFPRLYSWAGHYVQGELGQGAYTRIAEGQDGLGFTVAETRKWFSQLQTEGYWPRTLRDHLAGKLGELRQATAASQEHEREDRYRKIEETLRGQGYEDSWSGWAYFTSDLIEANQEKRAQADEGGFHPHEWYPSVESDAHGSYLNAMVASWWLAKNDLNLTAQVREDRMERYRRAGELAIRWYQLDPDGRGLFGYKTPLHRLVIGPTYYQVNAIRPLEAAAAVWGSALAGSAVTTQWGFFERMGNTGTHCLNLAGICLANQPGEASSVVNLENNSMFGQALMLHLIGRKHLLPDSFDPYEVKH